MGRRAHRPGAARSQAAAASGPAPDADPVGARGRLRRVQLPARVLGRRRRHDLGVGGRAARSSSRRTRRTRDLRPLGLGHPDSGARDRDARGRLLDGPRPLARGRHHARHAPVDPRGGLHRLARRGPDALRRRGPAAGPDPRLRRDGLVQPGVPAARRSRRSAERRSRRASRPRSRWVPVSSARTRAWRCSSTRRLRAPSSRRPATCSRRRGRHDGARRDQVAVRPGASPRSRASGASRSRRALAGGGRPSRDGGARPHCS